MVSLKGLHSTTLRLATDDEGAPLTRDSTLTTQRKCEGWGIWEPSATCSFHCFAPLTEMKQKNVKIFSTEKSQFWRWRFSVLGWYRCYKSSSIAESVYYFHICFKFQCLIKSLGKVHRIGTAEKICVMLQKFVSRFSASPEKLQKESVHELTGLNLGNIFIFNS